MGVALDRVLSKIKGDSPRHPGVLRAELRRAGDVDFAKGGNGTEVYVMGVADFYEVATAFPTGVGIDGLYDWLGLWKLSDLKTANEDLSLYGDLVCPLGLRFDPDVALVQDGPFDKLAMAITKSLSQEEAHDYTGLTKEEAAVELATWVRYALPFPAELCEYGGTRAASLITLRRLLRESSGGQALLITPANVATVIQHHEAAKLVIGNNVGGLVALNMVIELLRLSLRTSVTSAALSQLGTAMAALNDLLPALRSERIAGLPPNDRLAYVAKELALWDKADRTAARGGGGGGGGSTDTPGDERSGLVGYGAVYQGALRRLLASEDYTTAEAAVTAALDANDYGEAITIIFSSGFLPLIHALIGYRRSLPGNPLVDRIAEELRPLGPQWVSDTLGKALLPEPTAPHKRKRLNAMPLVWLLLCKFQMDNIPWEDICYAIIAEGNGRAHPPKILPAACFTSVARLREIEGGIVALLEAFGRVRGGERSFDTFLKKVYRYESSAKAVAQTDKGDTISSCIKAVLAEASVAGAAVLLSDDPTRVPSVHFVQPGSGGEAKLDEAIAELPETSSIVSALLKAVSPAQAAQLGLSTQIDVPDTLGLRRHEPAVVPGAPAAPRLAAATEPEAGPLEPGPAATPRETGKKPGGATGGDAKTKDPPDVGAWSKRLTEETPTEYRIGNKKDRKVISKEAVREVVGDAIFNDKSKMCAFSLLSNGKWAHALCNHKGEKGHESPTSHAHTWSNYPTGCRKKLQGLLVAMAATTEATQFAPAAGVGFARRCGVSCLASATFDKVGGMIFVPVRYASPHVPEFGLPRGASDCWFGETGIVVERGVREAALATACNWSDALWGRDAALVPFGLFEDSGGAGGQVTGVLTPPPTRAEHVPEGAADLRGAHPTKAAPRNCIDLFAGAGGLALGLGDAGYHHLALVERDARKVATLERNGFTQAVCADVGDVDYSQWRGAVDLLSGGPPCQPFSGGGLLLGEADARNGWEVTIAATAALRPRAVLFENVQGMLTGRFAGYRRAISARLDDLGYHHNWVPLDAANFGVPQRRRRVFLIGFADRRAWEAFTLPPTSRTRLTVRAALRRLGPPNGMNGHDAHGRAREYPGHTASTLDAPSKTIVAGGRGLGGGSGTVRLDSGEVRYFTVREAATLQTFPPTWRFDEAWSRAFVEIGNAVPPVMARKLGGAIAAALDAVDAVAPMPEAEAMIGPPRLGARRRRCRPRRLARPRPATRLIARHRPRHDRRRTSRPARRRSQATRPPATRSRATRGPHRQRRLHTMLRPHRRRRWHTMLRP